MEFKYAKLRGKIVEKFRTQGEFAKALGITEQALSKKLNGITSFSHKDILKWCELLDIKHEEIGYYFFS